MRLPLDQMQIRTADIEAKIHNPAISEKLKWKASPLGGMAGNVRSSGQRQHRGWDLYADVSSPAYAIGDGYVTDCDEHGSGSFGRYIVLKLTGRTGEHLAAMAGVKTVWVLYGHLGMLFFKKGDAVKEGAILGRTSRSGNAKDCPPHLHIQFSSSGDYSRADHKKGWHDVIDPVKIFGGKYFQCLVNPPFDPHHWDKFRGSAR